MVMLDGYQKLCNLVLQCSFFSGRLPVEEKFCVTVISDNTTMEYLVPTTSEAGVCTTALVDFLTLTHNNFIERCRALVGENEQT